MAAAKPSGRRAPAGVDPRRPSIARVYDAALGGKDNYEVDRKVLAELEQVVPTVLDLAWTGRNFLIRVARFLADQTDVHQFIDCGSGLPTAENTHQVVQRVNPDARVIYIDNDPVVLAHGRALLEDNDRTFLADADLFEPEQVFANEHVNKHLDLTEPIALLHISTLHHHVGDRHRPAEIMKEYVDRLPSGSFVAIGHFADPENEYTQKARDFERILVEGDLGSGTFRTLSEIEELFPGLEMMSPGVVQAVDWWPDGPKLKAPDETHQLFAGGVGRKP
ncbi:S-adenosyl methyltransferase [Haloactinopolyspora alba]|uniref:S-adenosyl methyltransferase n=1 Tax=Haloactinopolyspora alba TaxID=648780 RepID=A0A2P8EFM6_9ACTN|nr:SAM-dependent methyltransferase [Haloactinopolyspora alba]PSL08268.1 S-adenosyl methyltransferase [Haloactinopolyspora alba]